MNADFEKKFLKELRAILTKNDFLKLNTSNYFYNNSHIQCMFNIQKSKYSKQYYSCIIHGTIFKLITVL